METVNAMRRIAALLLGLALAGLCGCGAAAPEETTPETTAFVPATIAYTPPTTAPWVPNDPPAKMEPLQGGKMLYAFQGKVPYKSEEYEGEIYHTYYLGLVDQDGKLVSPPIYQKIDYFYDEGRQRIIGMVAQLDQETTIYQLNGESRVLPCESYRATVCPGGRYIVVEAAKPGSLSGAWVGDPLKDGLYDIVNDRYVIEPKIGQAIGYSGGSMVFKNQFNSTDAQGDIIEKWFFNYADESLMEWPLYQLGNVWDYYPETGWFGEHIVYDSNLQIVPGFEDWSVDNSGFDGGEWCIIYNNYHYSGMYTWINRKGELAEKMYNYISRTGTSFLVEDDDTFILLDASLQEVCKPGEGEKLVPLDKAFLLVNETDKHVIKAFDTDGNFFPKTDAFKCWASDEMAFAVQDGNWRALDLRPFYPELREDHESYEDPYARALVVSEDYVIVETGIYQYFEGTRQNIFAVDWNGKPYPNCPLKPYFKQLASANGTAGPQGPSYYWVEHNGKRGYINTRGEWLFIDETN